MKNPLEDDSRWTVMGDMAPSGREDYEPVAVCPHITGYFQKGAYGTIRAECKECGWASVDAPTADVGVPVFGVRGDDC